MSKRQLSNLLKIGVTVAGLVLVLNQFEPARLAAILLQADLRWLLVGVLLVTGSLVLRAFRWSILLQGLGRPVPFGRLIALYFVGSFFNAFLPSGFGGDVVRVVEITRDIDLDVATGTVLLDRLTGLTMLFVVALLALPLAEMALPPALAGLTAAGAAGCLLLLALLHRGGFWRRLLRRLPPQVAQASDRSLGRVLVAVEACGWPAILGALGVSALFNLVLTGWWAAAGRALGLEAPFTTYLLAVPLLSVALLAPSVGGLGVRELVAPALFAAAGYTGAQAVSLSLLVFALERASGLPGAPLYLLGTWRRRAATGAPESSDQDR